MNVKAGDILLVQIPDADDPNLIASELLQGLSDLHGVYIIVLPKRLSLKTMTPEELKEIGLQPILKQPEVVHG